MSDSDVNKHHVKGKDIIPVSNNLEYLAGYNSTRSVSSTTELLIQFLASVMTKDYEMALKYCTEILEHEPNNLTALEFYPLIVEKLEQIENEETESTSSESSLSSSSTSSSSSEENENELFLALSYNKGVKHNTSPMDKMHDDASSTNTLKKRTTKEKVTGTNIVLNAQSKKTSSPTTETNKTTGNETPLLSNLLIHPTETKILIGNNASNMGTRTASGQKKGKQTSNNLQKQPSKILLHTTRTVTFPKKLPSPNLARTEIPE